MNRDILILGAAVAGVMFMAKQAQANSTKPAVIAQSGTGKVANNINNELWKGVLGGAWKALVDQSASSAGSDGSFLMRNWLGEVVTSDGKPIDSNAQAISLAISGDAAGPGGIIDTSAPDGTDWLMGMGW